MARPVRIGDDYYGVDLDEITISEEIISRLDSVFEDARNMSDDQFDVYFSGANTPTVAQAPDQS